MEIRESLNTKQINDLSQRCLEESLNIRYNLAGIVNVQSAIPQVSLNDINDTSLSSLDFS